MSWRGLHFSNPAFLCLKNSSLHIQSDQGEALSFPLEDLSYLVLESPQITLTSALLAACSQQGCIIITCDSSHMPNGTLLPFHTHYRQSGVLEKQIELSQPKKKRLWQNIIQAKIHNQSSCLSILGKDESDVNSIAVLKHKVKSGDSSNTEALAARLYWRIWQTGFIRNQQGDNRINSMLDYGYALIRACLSREVVAQGFIPSLGIHHCNKLNAFNLVDDLIEPWRPFVDFHVAKILKNTEEKEVLDTHDKRELSTVLHKPMLLDGEREILEGCKLYVQDIKKYYEGKIATVNMPCFIE